MSLKRKSKDASDPQAEKFYAWTWQWMDWNRKTISLADCRALIRRACKAWKVKPPTVRSAPSTQTYSSYDDVAHRIELVTSHQNIAIALHEATHAICNDLFADRHQSHGPSFVAIYLHLMEQVGSCPPEALYASARKAGLKIARDVTA